MAVHVTEAAFARHRPSGGPQGGWKYFSSTALVKASFRFCLRISLGRPRQKPGQVVAQVEQQGANLETKTIQSLVREMREQCDRQRRPVVPEDRIEFVHQLPAQGGHKADARALTLGDYGLGGGHAQGCVFAVLEAPRFVVSTMILLQILAQEHMLSIAKKTGPLLERHQGGVAAVDEHARSGNALGDGNTGIEGETPEEEEGEEEGGDRWTEAASRRRRALNESLVPLKVTSRVKVLMGRYGEEILTFTQLFKARADAAVREHLQRSRAVASAAAAAAGAAAERTRSLEGETETEIETEPETETRTETETELQTETETETETK